MTSTAQARPGRRAVRPSLTGRFSAWFGRAFRGGRVPAFLVAVAAGILAYGFLVSGDFAVNDVTVRGIVLGDPVEIANAAGSMGVSVFQVDPDRIAAGVAALPYVQQAEVEVRLPSKVVITIIEPEPVIVWSTGESSFLIDGHGQVIQTGDLPGIPRVESNAIDLVPGAVIPPERVAAVLAIQEQFGTQVDAVTWNERNGLTVRLSDRRLIILGEADRFPLKFAVYQDVRTRGLAWSVLDLREPDRPYFE